MTPSDEKTKNHGRAALFVSVAANIFLVAFILGRFSSSGMPPQNFDGHPMHEFGMHGPGMHGGGASFMMGDHMPPPPLMGPNSLFTPEERRANEAKLHGSFEKMDGLRKDFAAQLKAGPLTKDEVLKHFSSVDSIMDQVKSDTQEKAAEKISLMDADARKNFAESLLNREGHPPECAQIGGTKGEKGPMPPDGPTHGPMSEVPREPMAHDPMSQDQPPPPMGGQPRPQN